MEDEFLTKVIKVLYRRNLRIVAKSLDTTTIGSCVGPSTEGALLKLWSKGLITWNSICKDRVLLTRKEILSQLGAALTEEEYIAIKNCGSRGIGRTLSQNVDALRDEWDKAMDFDPIPLEGNLEDFTIKDDTLFAWTDGSMQGD